MSHTSTRVLLPNMRLSVFFLLFLVIVFMSVRESEANLRLCGTKLTKALLTICNNQLCGGFAVAKRSSPEFFMMDGSSPSQSQLQSFHYAVKRDGGIATACCVNRCSFSYLKTFCCNQ